MKATILKLCIILASGLVITVLTALINRYEYVPINYFDKTQIIIDSEELKVKTWGWPIRFIMDSPGGLTKDGIDKEDKYFPICFLIDYLLTLSVVILLYFAYTLLKRKRKIIYHSL